jgi:ABC-2 type transport system permease protein
MMARNIITLVLNDLAIAFKNKTIYLIIFIPFFVFLSLKLIDSSGADFKKINIGLIQKEIYAPVILQTIKAADGAFRVSSVSDEEEGNRWLKEKNRRPVVKI